MKQPPVVTSCDGDYDVDARNGELRWTRPLVDADSATGNLEFSVRAPGAKVDAFFPVSLDFVGDKTSYCGVNVSIQTARLHSQGGGFDKWGCFFGV